MEGIVAKRKDSVYRPGKRSADWLKIKSRPQQEFVVGGFTEGKGSRKHLGALLLGAYRNENLHYFGHSGSGFSEKGLRFGASFSLFSFSFGALGPLGGFLSQLLACCLIKARNTLSA